MYRGSYHKWVAASCETGSPDCAVFLEKECKQALLEEKERKKSEQAKEAQRAAEKAKNDLTEQLKEQEKLGESQLLEQDTARKFRSF